MYYNLGSNSQATCKYGERVGEKLSEDRQFCHHFSVFIRTSPFDNGRPGYSITAFVRLQVNTLDTRDIIHEAMRSLDSNWQPVFHFVKAGIIQSELRPNGFAQLNLLDEQTPRAGSDALMSLIDMMNRFGRDSFGFVGIGIQSEWRMKREKLSKAWTTNWKNIPLARIC